MVHELPELPIDWFCTFFKEKTVVTTVANDLLFDFEAAVGTRLLKNFLKMHCIVVKW